MATEAMFPILVQWGDGELELVDEGRWRTDPVFRFPEQFARVIDRAGALFDVVSSLDGATSILVPQGKLLDEALLGVALDADPAADPADTSSIWSFGDERPMQRLLDYVGGLRNRFRAMAEPGIKELPGGAEVVATHRCRGWWREPDVRVVLLRIVWIERRCALEARIGFVRKLLAEGEWFLRCDGVPSCLVHDSAWTTLPDGSLRVPRGFDASTLIAVLSGREWLLTRAASTPAHAFEAGWSPPILLARHLTVGAEAALAGESESGPWSFAFREGALMPSPL